MNRAKSYLVALVAVITLVIACEPGDDPTDDRSEGEAVARAVAEVVVKNGNAITKLSTPLASLFEKSAADGTLRERLAAALSGGVVDAGCLSVSWTLTSATVDFDSCQIPGTGEVLDGSITIVVKILAGAVVITFDDLSLGSNTFYGSVTARLNGRIGSLALRIDADVTLADVPATLVVSGLSVEPDLKGVTVSGEGAVTSSALDATATIEQLRWNLADCLPTSGSIAFVEGKISGTITFLETTPATGEVDLEILPFPVARTALLPACQ